ncbi:hypothetical protein F5888DRAFT_888566 [Russula emetica]|nr:hypothetical protein F5888DRAFT_888566 [Russula emetica]
MVPVLSLAADALIDLDGADAITGLWTIFAKCKGSLQDGPRLEYISWRLWYRELKARRSNKPFPILPHSPHLIPASCPLTPVSEQGIEHPGSCPASPDSRKTEPEPHPECTTKFPPSFSSTTPPPARRLVTTRPKPNSSVGKIIRDMIPDKLDLARPPTRPPLPKLDPIIVAPDPGGMVVAPVPSMRLPPPSTPPPSGGHFPRVVVVNPTPHPTPPATPVPAGPPTSLPTTGQHLAPPPRLSSAVARHHSPDATTAPNPVTTPLACPPPHLLTPVPIATASPPQPNLSRLPHPPPPHLQSQVPRPIDDTLKPSDRRFFLQQDQSPSPERDGPDRGSNGSISTGKSPSETGELQPSSVTSNQTRASAASTSSHPTGRGRRSKNPPFRPALTRLNSGRHVVQVMRKDLTRVRPPTQHNVDKAPKAAGPSRPPPRSPIEPHPPAKVQTSQVNGATAPKDPNAHASASAAPRRGIVSNSSSEYATTDTEEEDDDDSWASEEVSEGAMNAPSTGTGKHPPTKEEIRLREAALEAQRQRELFVKQPKRSYSNLGRTQSGLLSQLLNPDPNVFPPGRPYRVVSTHDVTRTTGIPSTLTAGKSSAALPLAARVTAQAPMVPAATPSNHGGYRPKGRPQGEELEDESDSPDDPDDTIQVSHSLAQQRLAALAAAKPSRRRASDNQVPTTTQTSAITAARPILPTVATAPIPLNHPWNLPAPAPPTTPRTTRRQMLATELSESLRRNLLWERQVSKTNLLGNAGRRNGLGGGGGGSRLVTTVVNGNGNAQAGPSQQQQQRQHQRGQGSGDGAQDSIAERRQRALARNRTWADDFHYTGW